jgi:uncharacterized DUF497 family protein
MVEFEWDEDKSFANLGKHGIDFLDARQLFDGRPLYNTFNERYAELRIVSTGRLGETFYTVTWTLREGKVRIISCRRARHGEKRAHRALHGGRD